MVAAYCCPRVTGVRPRPGLADRRRGADFRHAVAILQRVEATKKWRWDPLFTLWLAAREDATKRLNRLGAKRHTAATRALVKQVLEEERILTHGTVIRPRARS